MFSRCTTLLRLGAATLVGATGLVLTLSASPAVASATICSKFSPSMVSSVLGVKATSVNPVVNATVSVCWYKVGGNAYGTFIRVQTHDSLSGFTADEKLAAKESEKPVTDTRFAPYRAFSTSLGSASYGYTYSVTVLKKTTELEVGSAGTKLAKVEALAKKVLPRL